MEAGLTARAEEGERHWPSFAWSWPGCVWASGPCIPSPGSSAGSICAGRLEELAIYRQIAEQAPERGVLLFHGSAVAVDGQTYLFTAKSGTGKSTHTRLWRQRFGDRALMVNDDKPLLRFTETEVLVCGTPWNGKHHLSAPVQLPLKALCVLTRDTTNHIEPLEAREAFPTLYQQCYHPQSPGAMARTLALLGQLTEQAGLYHLGCNMDPEAAEISYNGMQEERA